MKFIKLSVCLLILCGWDMAVQGEVKIELLQDDYQVLTGLPDSRVNIFRTSDFIQWDLVYRAIQPDNNQCVVGGKFRLTQFFRVEVSASPLSQRILTVSAENGNDDEAANGAGVPFKSLSAALRFCRGGDIVRVEKGIYPIQPVITFGDSDLNAPIEIVNKHKITVFGEEGSVLFGEGPGEFFTIRGCEDIIIDGLEFRGTKPEVPENPLQLFTMLELSDYNQNITIRNCRFIRFGNHGVSQLHSPRSSRNVLIEDCYFEDGGDASVAGLLHDGAAVSGIGSTWTIRNNQLVRCNRGLEIEGAYRGLPSENILIEGNRITDSENRGIMLFATIAPSNSYRHIRIQNNHLDVSDSGDGDSGGTGISFDGASDVQISGNTIHGYKVGIELSPAKSISHFSITGNDISECDIGVFIRGLNNNADNIQVTSNNFLRNVDFGILAHSGNGIISRNTFDNNGTQLKHSAGILIADLLDNGTSYTIDVNSFAPTQNGTSSQFDIVVQHGYDQSLLNKNVRVGGGNPPEIHQSSWPEFLNRRISEISQNPQ